MRTTISKLRQAIFIRNVKKVSNAGKKKKIVLQKKNYHPSVCRGQRASYLFEGVGADKKAACRIRKHFPLTLASIRQKIKIVLYFLPNNFIEEFGSISKMVKPKRKIQHLVNLDSAVRLTIVKEKSPFCQEQVYILLTREGGK